MVINTKQIRGIDHGLFGLFMRCFVGFYPEDWFTKKGIGHPNGDRFLRHFLKPDTPVRKTTWGMLRRVIRRGVALTPPDSNSQRFPLSLRQC